MDKIVSINNLSFMYPRSDKPILNNINLEVEKGEFIGLVGKSGCGKSTLLYHLTGIIPHAINGHLEGTVKVCGLDTSKHEIPELATHVGMVFQNPNVHLFADTVYDEVAFVLHNHKVPEEEIDTKVRGIIDHFELTRYLDTYPRDLSGGERQRVALASVMVGDPKVLLLDEPTRGMEYRRKRRLMDYLKDYHDRGGTVILISHDMELVAQEPVERVVLMGEGRIVADGTRREILARSLHFSPQINRLVQPFESMGVPGDILTLEEMMCGLR
jgi:energy-coupling factor transporter ATP-binding protein EcfA2